MVGVVGQTASMRTARRRMWWVVAVLSATVACGDDLAVPTLDVVADERLDGVAARSGLEVEVVVEGLQGPTQFIVMAEGDYLVAEINGGENDGDGRVVRVDGEGNRSVVLAGLDKPTGIALVGDELWVMERSRLTRGPLDGERTVVADELPNNGRSEGTLTVLPDGRVLFDTSGSKRGSTVVDGSGRLFTVDSSDDAALPVELASGFKHAYAHAVDEDGTLWTTEMTDGRFDDRPGVDEIVAVVPGEDHGWPKCVGDNRAVTEFGGTAARCAEVPPSQAVFAPSATPTGLTVSPFADDTLWVALWNERRVVAIDADPSVRPSPVTDVLTGLDRPQHLVATSNEVFLSDFGAGTMLRITESG